MKVVKIENYVINCEQVRTARVGRSFGCAKTCYLIISMIGDIDNSHPSVSIEFNNQADAEKALMLLYTEMSAEN